jgi:hypothetical protein
MLAIGPDDGDFRPADKRVERHSFHFVLGTNRSMVLAIAFEKVDGNRQIDRVPPYPVMFESQRTYNRPYFQD